MTEVLISIRPKWAEKILNGEKTVEIRKSAPEPPFRAYVYCTYGTVLYEDFRHGNGTLHREIKLGLYNVSSRSKPSNALNGKVVAEFVCDKVNAIPPCSAHNGVHYPLITRPELAEIARGACLSAEELYDYGVKKENGCYGASSKVVALYAWHISELKIYEEPLELKAFSRLCKEYVPDYANDCDEYCGYFEHGQCKDGYKPIRRAPQSWQYTRKL